MIVVSFLCRNILCFPIKDRHNEVIGVAELCNKITGSYFTKTDENIAKTFSIYCCISIVNVSQPELVYMSWVIPSFNMGRPFCFIDGVVA